MIDLDELARLEREATPGPWTVAQSDSDSCFSAVEGPTSRQAGRTSTPIVADPVSPADAALIAAIRNALPELLARAQATDPGTYYQQWLEMRHERDAARAERDAARAEVERWRAVGEVAGEYLRDAMAASGRGKP